MSTMSLEQVIRRESRAMSPGQAIAIAAEEIWQSIRDSGRPDFYTRSFSLLPPLH